MGAQRADRALFVPLTLIALLTIQLTQQIDADVLPRRAVLGVPFTPVSQGKATELKLESSLGLVAMTPVAGLSADKAGVAAGDIILALNGKSVGVTSIAATVRELVAGDVLKLSVVRDGKSIELQANLAEKPRDPGNANYEVIYRHVVSNGQRMRTIITRPRTPGKHPGFMFIQGFRRFRMTSLWKGPKGTSRRSMDLCCLNLRTPVL